MYLLFVPTNIGIHSKDIIRDMRMDGGTKVFTRALQIMMKIGNNLNVRNQGIFKQMLVACNGKLWNDKNSVTEEYLLKWKKIHKNKRKQSRS